MLFFSSKVIFKKKIFPTRVEKYLKKTIREIRIEKYSEKLKDKVSWKLLKLIYVI